MDERFGFIHEKLDIKLLILFVLRRLPAPIDAESLADLVLIDGGIGYFDYKECLAELVNTAQIAETEDGYAVTEKGSENCAVLENSLPYSVRTKAERRLAPVADELRRSELVTARHEQREQGVTVQLAMSDGVGTVFDLRLLALDEEQAKRIEKNFKRRAEEFYNRFMTALTE